MCNAVSIWCWCKVVEITRQLPTHRCKQTRICVNIYIFAHQIVHVSKLWHIFNSAAELMSLTPRSKSQQGRDYVWYCTSCDCNLVGLSLCGFDKTPCRLLCWPPTTLFMLYNHIEAGTRWGSLWQMTLQFAFPLMIYFLILHKIPLKYLTWGPIDSMTTLGQIMKRATSHYVNQCWYVALTLICIMGPQWVIEMLCYDIRVPFETKTEMPLYSKAILLWNSIGINSRFDIQFGKPQLIKEHNASNLFQQYLVYM